MINYLFKKSLNKFNLFNRKYLDKVLYFIYISRELKITKFGYKIKLIRQNKINYFFS
jgi:hypothetical protein